MATIASLQVLLSAQTAKFDAALKQSGSRTQQFASSVKSALATVGVAFSAAAAFGFLKSSFAAFEEEQKAIRKLDAVLRSTGGAAGFTSKQLQQMAVDLQKVTNFGDDVTINAQAMMATFTKLSGEVFKDAIVAAQNLSTVMGTDLQSAVVQVGKALQDPILGITALRRVGVNFDDKQKEVIKTLVDSNQVLKAQQMILKELAVEFGGAAEATRNFSESVTNDFGDLKEAIGGLGAAMVADGDTISIVIQDMTERVNAFNQSLDRTRTLGQTLRGFTGLFNPFQGVEVFPVSDIEAGLNLDAARAEFNAVIEAETKRQTAIRAKNLGGRAVEAVTTTITPTVNTAANLGSLAEQARKMVSKQVTAGLAESKRFIEQQKEMAEAGKRVWESVRTPMEEYFDEMERLNKLLEATTISQETFDRAVLKAGEALGEREEKQEEEFRKPIEDFSPAAMELGGAEAFSSIAAAANLGVDSAAKEADKAAVKSEVHLRAIARKAAREERKTMVANF